MRIVVLVSGTGSNLQAVIDAVKSGELDVEIAAVGADREGTYGVERSSEAGLETFVVNFNSFPTRDEWDTALTAKVASYAPDVVVSSGFMRIVSADFIDAFNGKYLNTHPALLPAFPGAHGVRDAMAYGVKVTGCTVHYVDELLDHGPTILQCEVARLDDDTVETLSARILEQEHRLYVQAVKKICTTKAQSTQSN